MFSQADDTNDSMEGKRVQKFIDYLPPNIIVRQRCRCSGAKKNQPRLSFLGFHPEPYLGCQREGLFKKYGLDVDPIFLRGGQVATQALAAGDPPSVNVGTTIQANLAGYDLVLIATIENKFYQLVFVRPGPPSLQHLTGETLGLR